MRKRLAAALIAVTAIIGTGGIAMATAASAAPVAASNASPGIIYWAAQPAGCPDIIYWAGCPG